MEATMASRVFPREAKIMASSFRAQVLGECAAGCCGKSFH
jgi:hypothetical protein